MSDNFSIDICDDNPEHLGLAMKIAFNVKHRQGATHYAVIDIASKKTLMTRVPQKTLVFFWTVTKDCKEIVPLPFKMNYDTATNFTLEWLKQVEYSEQPDHDGDNKKGYRIFNEDWGRIAGMWEAFIAIQPCWMMYGK